MLRILRVFPRRTAFTPTDDLVRVGDPGLYDVQVGVGYSPLDIDEVHVSCTFTWDRRRCAELVQTWRLSLIGVPVLAGGPGWCHAENEKQPFVPGLYVKPGVTFTSRGCPNRCPWCLVPAREGALRELPIQPGHIVQDNNLLACSDQHFAAVCAMLAGQPRAARFAGGLEAARLTPWHVAQLRGLRIREVWLAADGPAVSLRFQDAVYQLRSWLPRRKVRAYVLIGFYSDDTPSMAAARLEAVWKAGALPFAQIYRPPDESRAWSALGRDWRKLAREWMRPAAVFANHPEAR